MAIIVALSRSVTLLGHYVTTPKLPSNQTPEAPSHLSLLRHSQISRPRRTHTKILSRTWRLINAILDAFQRHFKGDVFNQPDEPV
jgi:hypothetical protein